MHYEPINHHQNNEAVSKGKVQTKQLRKASNVKQQEDHRDQHGYQEGKEKEKEKAGDEDKHREDQDPVAKFGGPRHDVHEDMDVIRLHRKKKLMEETAKKVAAAGAGVLTLNSAGAEGKGKGEHEYVVYKTPEISKELAEALSRKDVQDLGSQQEGSNEGGFRSILHQVAQLGDLETITKLLKNKSEKEIEILVNAKDSGGWQPLHEAVRGTVIALVYCICILLN